ncbi:MAG: DUF2341 domain-containing protein [Candidatus Omnitrophota bacterium]
MGFKKYTIIRIFFAFIIYLYGGAFFAYGLPEIDHVESGDVNVQYAGPNSMTITASDHSIINYSSFNIAQNETVMVMLPSSNSDILNRVTGSGASQLLGSLDCNGIFILVNTSGINIGPNATITANGLVLSTRDIANSDFMNSEYVFRKLTGAEKDMLLVNQGTINIRRGGFGVLIAAGIENSGVISAPLGKIALAGGDAVKIGVSGGGLISVAIEEKTASSILDASGNPITDQIKSTGTISAPGGTVILNAQSINKVFTRAINLEGCVKANRFEEHDGIIKIVASDDVRIGAAMEAKGGSIDVASDESIIAAADVTAEDGDISMKADADKDGAGKFTQESGVISTDGGGNIYIDGSETLTIGNIRAEGGAVYIGTDSAPLAIIADTETVVVSDYLKAAAGSFYINSESITTHIVRDEGIFIQDASREDNVITIRGDELGTVKYLAANNITFQTDNDVNTSPGVIIPGNTVTLIARQFGSNVNPVNIDAAATHINRSMGDIDITQSLGIGTSILICGPPEDGFGAITYNRDSHLVLEAEHITLRGEGPTCLYGDITFSNLYITVPAKEIYFEPGKTYTILGLFKIEGAYAQHVKLLSQQDGVRWYIDPSGPRELTYVWVKDSYNLDPVEVAMTLSTNRGNNFNWDANITWNGSTSLWNVSGNWIGGVVPGDGDVAVFNGTSTRNCSINASINILGLCIESGYTGIITQAAGKTVTLGSTGYTQSGGTFTGGNSAITVNGVFNLNGGTFSTGTGTVTFGGVVGDTVTISSGILKIRSGDTAADIVINAGTWTNSGGTISYNAGSVVSTGILSSVGDYYNLDINSPGSTYTLADDLVVKGNLSITAGTMDVTAADYGVTVSGNFVAIGTFNAQNGTVTLDGGTQYIYGSSTFHNLTKTGSAGTLYFQAGSTQIIAGTLTLRGVADADGQRLSLRSTVSPAQWSINPAAFDIAYVDVQDSANTGGSIINPAGSTNSGNNTNWFVWNAIWIWDGVTGLGTWSNPDNWNDGSGEHAVPNESTDVLFGGSLGGVSGTDTDSNCENSAFLGSIKSLTIRSGYTKTITLNRSLAITGALTVNSGTLAQAAGAGNAISAGSIAVRGGTFLGGNADITSTGNVAILSGSFTSTSGTLYVGGNWINEASTFFHNSGTVDFNGSGTQDLEYSSDAFNHLTHSGAGTLYIWPYRRDITIDHSITTEDLLGFPLLVYIDADFGIYSYARANGEDIIFTDANGDRMPYEIEYYYRDNAGHTVTALIWVKVPDISSTTDTTFYMSYGNPSCPAQQDPAHVWDSNYAAVYHMANTNDSTGVNDGTASGGVTSTSSGSIDGAYNFDGIDGEILVPDSPSLDITSAVTISLWLKTPGTYDASSPKLVGKHTVDTNDPWHFYEIDFNVTPPDIFIRFEVSDGTSYYNVPKGAVFLSSTIEIQSDTWYYVSGTWDGTTSNLYIDGGLNNTTTTSFHTLATNDEPLRMGSFTGNTHHYKGILDEVRISNIARPASWAGAEFNNQFSDTGRGYQAIGAQSGGVLTIAGNLAQSGTGPLAAAGMITFNDASQNSNVYGAITFYDLACTTAGKNIYFEAGYTGTVTHALTLTGSAANLIKLRSTSDGTRWNIDPQNTINVTYVDVKDSANLNGKVINPPYSVDSGNNVAWFSVPPINPDVIPRIPQPPNPPVDPGNGEPPGGGPLISYERQKYGKYYIAGKYRTVVIVYDGKVTVAPYDDNGPQYDKGKLLTAGQKAAYQGEIK